MGIIIYIKILIIMHSFHATELSGTFYGYYLFDKIISEIWYLHDLLNFLLSIQYDTIFDNFSIIVFPVKTTIWH